MSPELTEFLSNTRIVRQTLAKILPPEAVNYFMMLVVKDLSHRKLEKLVETSVEESK